MEAGVGGLTHPGLRARRRASPAAVLQSLCQTSLFRAPFERPLTQGGDGAQVHELRLLREEEAAAAALAQEASAEEAAALRRVRAADAQRAARAEAHAEVRICLEHTGLLPDFLACEKQTQYLEHCMNVSAPVKEIAKAASAEEYGGASHVALNKRARTQKGNEMYKQQQHAAHSASVPQYCVVSARPARAAVGSGMLWRRGGCGTAGGSCPSSPLVAHGAGCVQALQERLQERDVRLAAAERARAQLEPLRQQLAGAEVHDARHVDEPGPAMCTMHQHALRIQSAHLEQVRGLPSLAPADTTAGLPNGVAAAEVQCCALWLFWGASWPRTRPHGHALSVALLRVSAAGSHTFCPSAGALQCAGAAAARARRARDCRGGEFVHFVRARPPAGALLLACPASGMHLCHSLVIERYNMELCFDGA